MPQRLFFLAVLALFCASAPEVDWGELATTTGDEAAAKAVGDAVSRQADYVASLEKTEAALEKRVKAGEADEALLRAVMALVRDCSSSLEQLAQAGAAMEGKAALKDSAKKVAAALEKAQAASSAALALVDKLQAKVALAEPPPTPPGQSVPTAEDLVIASLTPPAEKAAAALASRLGAARSRRVLVTQVAVVESATRPEPPSPSAAFTPTARGLAFSQVLFQELSRARFQVTAVGDPGPFLGRRPPDVGGRPASEYVLVRGAIAVQPRKHVAWSLEAIDLAGRSVVAEASAVVEAR